MPSYADAAAASLSRPLNIDTPPMPDFHCHATYAIDTSRHADDITLITRCLSADERCRHYAIDADAALLLISCH